MKEKIQNGIGIFCIILIFVFLFCYLFSLHEDTHYVYEKIETSTTEATTTVVAESETEVLEVTESTTENTTSYIDDSIYANIKYVSTSAKPTDFSKLGKSLILINNEYMLPEDYEWDLLYWYNGSKATVERLALPENKNTLAVDSIAYQPLKDMFNDADAAGVPLQLVSAYRSIQKQDSLFSKSVDSGMASGLSFNDAVDKANLSRMRPGCSEHNVGIGFDILAKGNFYLTSKFEETKEFAWLTENAHKYGFILRYPKDKTDITEIVYEPWHWRYVGVEHATKINELGYCLEEYIEFLELS